MSKATAERPIRKVTSSELVNDGIGLYQLADGIYLSDGLHLVPLTYEQRRTLHQMVLAADLDRAHE